MMEGATERLRSPRRISQDATTYERWVAHYGVELAERLEPHRRYSLMAIEGHEYAYGNPTDYLRALGRAWSAGLLPEPRPSVLGAELPDAAPALRDVDRHPS
jgi:hypothetical protein